MGLRLVWYSALHLPALHQQCTGLPAIPNTSSFISLLCELPNSKMWGNYEVKVQSSSSPVQSSEYRLPRKITFMKVERLQSFTLLRDSTPTTQSHQGGVTPIGPVLALATGQNFGLEQSQRLAKLSKLVQRSTSGGCACHAPIPHTELLVQS